MKKNIFVIIVLISITLMVGCSVEKTEKEVLMDCQSTFESEFEHVVQENIEYHFDFTNNIVEKMIMATLNEEEELTDEVKNEVSEALQQNYCNSEIPENYSCNANPGEKEIVVMETGEINKVLGIKNKLSKKKVKKILEEKGFTCQEIDTDTENNTGEEVKSGAGLTTEPKEEVKNSKKESKKTQNNNSNKDKKKKDNKN